MEAAGALRAAGESVPSAAVVRPILVGRAEIPQLAAGGARGGGAVRSDCEVLKRNGEKAAMECSALV